MAWTVQLSLLLVLTLSDHLILCRRTFSFSIPNLDLELEPALPTGEEDDSEPIEVRPFPSLRSKPPVRLPEGSLLRPSGSVYFPNDSVLMTTYYNVAFNTTAGNASGVVRLANGSTVSSSLTPHHLPPGLVLNSTTPPTEDNISLILPKGSLVFRNGTILVYNHYKIPTVFLEGFIPYCDGIKCHLKSP